MIAWRDAVIVEKTAICLCWLDFATTSGQTVAVDNSREPQVFAAWYCNLSQDFDTLPMQD